MVNLKFNQLLTGLRNRREQELKEKELKGQEAEIRAGGLYINKVEGYSLNIPHAARQQKQPKVIFTLRDFIERKKAEMERQEEETENNVENDSDIEEVVEVEKDIHDKDGDSTDDNVSMDDNSDSDLELIKPNESNPYEEIQKTAKEDLVSDIDNKIEVLNNIIPRFGPTNYNSVEVDTDAKEHNLKQDLKKELTKSKRTDEEDSDIDDILQRKVKKNPNLESTDDEDEDDIPPRKVKNNLKLESTDEEDDNEDEDVIHPRKVKKNLKLESTDEEEDYEDNSPPRKGQEYIKLGRYSGMSVLKTNQNPEAIFEQDFFLLQKKVLSPDEKHFASTSITSLPPVNKDNAKRKATKSLEKPGKSPKIYKKATKNQAKITPNVIENDPPKKAITEDVTLEEEAEDDDEAASFDDFNENLTEEFDLCLHGDLVYDYLCYECTYNRWRVDWNSVHPAAESKDKPVFTELSHKLNVGRFRNISIKLAADTSPRKGARDQPEEEGKKAEEEMVDTPGGPSCGAPPRARPTRQLPPGLQLSSKSGRLPSGISFSTFKPTEEKTDSAYPPSEHNPAPRAAPADGNTPPTGTTPSSGTTPVPGNTTAPGNTHAPGITLAPGNTPDPGNTPAPGNVPAPGAAPCP